MKGKNPFAQLLVDEVRHLEKTYGALVDERQAARLLGLSRRTLQGWRMRRCGPPFFKFGRGGTALVRYPTLHLRRFLAGTFASPSTAFTAVADPLPKSQGEPPMTNLVLDSALLTDLGRLQERFGVLLDEHRAASYLGVSTRTLGRWRRSAEGPAFCELRFENRTVVRYPTVALERFLAERFVAGGEYGLAPDTTQDA